MYQIDKSKFGEFVSQLRKEKGMTQKELAEKLYVSDKAVSKWERGFSIPDVTILIPLAQCLGVCVTELLECRIVESNTTMDACQVEELVKKTLVLTGEDKQKAVKKKTLYIVLFFISVIVTCLEILFLLYKQITVEELMYNLMTVELLGLIFGGYFMFLAKEQLPLYYDENKISDYRDGVFHMNLPGVAFTNKNWPFILRTARIWCMIDMVVFPIVYYICVLLIPDVWVFIGLFVTLGFSLGGLFIPLYITAKKHS